jgi:hypothetical protein
MSIPYLVHLYLARCISLVQADSKIGKIDQFSQHNLHW